MSFVCQVNVSFGLMLHNNSHFGMISVSSQEEASICELTVRVIQAKNLHGTDVGKKVHIKESFVPQHEMSNPDCYVCLWLPTSLTDKRRTKTIWNNPNPVWEETFYFRVHSQIKNILELSLHDEDVGTADDHLFTVCYDLGNVPLNGMVMERFMLNKEFQEELHVEFCLVPLPETKKKVTTNGVLVCPDMVALEVTMEKHRNKTFKRKTELVLNVRGSYETESRILLSSNSTSESRSDETALFHYPQDYGLEMKASLHKVFSTFDVTFSNEKENDDLHQTTVPLNLVSPKESEISIQMPSMEGKPLGMKLKTKECPEKLDVRLGFDLCNKEKMFLNKRQQIVAKALKNVLQLEQDLLPEEVPVVAIMATGGGARAMSCLNSHLCGLQKLGLLDCVSYIAGASGSTWAMSKLYEDPEWSQKELSESIHNAKKYVTKKKSTFSIDRLKYYKQELGQASRNGQKTSFTDLWGLMIESMFHSGRNESKLSDQQAALTNGQNPLPIYLVMNVKQDNSSTLDFKEWCEFTPYEVGLLKYGASIRTEDFGSEFYMGRLMKKHPEPRICYLQGIWGNVFSLNLVDTWYLTTQLETFWDDWVKDRIRDIDNEDVMQRRECSHLKTRLYTPAGAVNKILKGILTNRPIDSEQHNFLRGLHLHKDYHKHTEFTTWKDSHVDLSPNKLTPLSDNMCLVDAAYYINACFPPLLRPERKVDIIISFDYTLDTPLQAVKQTSTYCTTQGICFPTVSLSEEDEEEHKECYVFRDEDNPNAPIVLHFPLVNDTFKIYKEPGVLRSPEEMPEGDVEISGSSSPYYITNFTYSEQEYDRLMKLTQYNLLNNRQLITDVLEEAVKKRKAKILSGMYQSQALLKSVLLEGQQQLESAT
ncbi:cytosolic phospholipase A2 delta-like [Gastrophryne carolinensis]